MKKLAAIFLEKNFWVKSWHCVRMSKKTFFSFSTKNFYILYRSSKTFTMDCTGLYKSSWSGILWWYRNKILSIERFDKVSSSSPDQLTFGAVVQAELWVSDLRDPVSVSCHDVLLPDIILGMRIAELHSLVDYGCNIVWTFVSKSSSLKSYSQEQCCERCE